MRYGIVGIIRGVSEAPNLFTIDVKCEVREGSCAGNHVGD